MTPPERVGGGTVYNPPPRVSGSEPITPRWIELKNEAQQRKRLTTFFLIAGVGVVGFFLLKKFKVLK